MRYGKHRKKKNGFSSSTDKFPEIITKRGQKPSSGVAFEGSFLEPRPPAFPPVVMGNMSISSNSVRGRRSPQSLKGSIQQSQSPKEQLRMPPVKSFQRVDDMDEFNTPREVSKEVSVVEKRIAALRTKCITDKDGRLIKKQNLPGIPNVVHTLFYKMLCKETCLFKELQKHSLTELERRLNDILGNNWISREQFPDVLVMLIDSNVRISKHDSNTLFDVIDVDGNGDVGVAEISNALMVLLADDRHAFLQRCRNIISVRTSSASNLVYLSRYELLLLAESLIHVYQNDSDFPLIEKEINKMLSAFSFNLRGRIQLKLFQQYIEEHDELRDLMYDATDVAASQNEFNQLTIFEKAAGEDDQERHFMSRRQEQIKQSRTADAFLLDDQVLQNEVTLPSDMRETTEALRNSLYAKCYLLEEGKDGSCLVEWVEDGGISTVQKDCIKHPEDFAKALTNDVMKRFVNAGVIQERKRKISTFRKHKLTPVAPLKERILAAALQKSGNVYFESTVEETKGKRRNWGNAVKAARRFQGISIPQGPRSSIALVKKLRRPTIS